jgi:hypothetical protein
VSAGLAERSDTPIVFITGSRGVTPVAEGRLDLQTVRINGREVIQDAASSTSALFDAHCPCCRYRSRTNRCGLPLTGDPRS